MISSPKYCLKFNFWARRAKSEFFLADSQFITSITMFYIVFILSVSLCIAQHSKERRGGGKWHVTSHFWLVGNAWLGKSVTVSLGGFCIDKSCCNWCLDFSLKFRCSWTKLRRYIAKGCLKRYHHSVFLESHFLFLPVANTIWVSHWLGVHCTQFQLSPSYVTSSTIT